MLNADDFYSPKHALIFAAITDMMTAGEPVDALTVSVELGKRGALKRGLDGPYLMTLSETPPSPGNAKQYAQTVADKARLRKMAELGNRLQQLAYTDTTSTDEVNTLIGEGESLFREHYEADDRAMSFADLIASWEMWQQSSEGTIRTPWDALNHLLNGGLQRGRLYTIGARPGVGKSVGALNVSAEAARWGYGVTFFSLEMSGDEVTSRMLAAGAGADLGQLLRKRMDLETRHRVDAYIKECQGVKLQVVDRERITVEQIVAHCRALGRVDVVVVDYLQLLTASDKKLPREQQVSHMSRSLKIAARELNAAVIVCSQLNRGPLQNGKHRAPMLGDLRESGAIEQDSDCVLLLHHDEDDPGVVQMIVAKNRQGKTGDLVLNFEGHYARIT